VTLIIEPSQQLCVGLQFPGSSVLNTAWCAGLCCQVFSLGAFICAVIAIIWWPMMVAIVGFIHVAVFFVIHILNYFSDAMVALITVRLALI